MGCDIHLFVEKKTKSFIREDRINNLLDIEDNIEGEKWELTNIDLIDDRSYTVFGVLAGVRNPRFRPISNIKLFPDDASIKLRKIYDRDIYNYHSHSYFTLRELESIDWDKYCKEVDIIHPEVFRYQISDIFKNMKIMSENCSNPDDIRMVFWFDN